MDEQLFYIIPTLLISFVIHEYAHAWMANRLGDPTAKSMGRLTLNPLKHLDLFGSVILPAFLVFLRTLGSPLYPIALAKPVPVNFSRLRNPKRGIIYVGMAGPAINVIVALIFSQLLRLDLNSTMVMLCECVIVVNMVLAIFNMIPIPPLDGSRLVMGLLPNKWSAKYSQIEPFGILIVFALLPLGLIQKIVWPLIIAASQWMGVQNI